MTDHPDARDIDDIVNTAIERTVLPVLKEIQRELRKIKDLVETIKRRQ